jgi:hypothetical protein
MKKKGKTLFAVFPMVKKARSHEKGLWLIVSLPSNSGTRA